MSLLAQDERITRRVGAVVIVLLAAAIGFFVFVYDHLEWGRRVRLQVFFPATGGLREGAPVIVAGRTFGTVEAIALSPRGAPGPLDGEEGIVVTIAMPARHAERVTRGGDVFIASRGVLAERYLEIVPAAKDGPSLAEVSDPLLGREPPSLDRVMQRTWDNLMTMERFAREVRPELEELQRQFAVTSATLEGLVPDIAGVSSLRVATGELLDEARELREVGLGSDAGLAKLDAVIDRSRATIARLRSVLDLLEANAGTLGASTAAVRARLGDKGPAAIRAVELTIDRVRAAIDKVDPLLAKVADLNARIARGEGSLGRLARDPEFPEDAKELGKIMKRQPWKIISRPPD